MDSQCEFCFVRETLLKGLDLVEHRIRYERAGGKLLTAQLENVHEARRLLHKHKHNPTGAMA